MSYDALLKDLFNDSPMLLQQLSNIPITRFLSVEFPSIKQRRPDLLAERLNASPLHIEIQTHNDSSMPQRMLEYYLLIWQHCGTPPTQIVLYIGEKSLKMPDHIQHDHLQFNYQITNMRNLSCDQLLNSNALGDNLIALIGKLRNPQQAVQRTLQRITQLPNANLRHDYLERIAVIAGLRLKQLPAIVQQEIQRMTITVNIEENPIFQEVIQRHRNEATEKGRMENARHFLSRQLAARFGEPLPGWVQQRIQEAEYQQLENWSVQILQAKTLEDALADKSTTMD